MKHTSELLNKISILRPYISDEAAQKLKQYRYSGGDTGLVYIYFYNPLAIKLVSFTPEWIA